MTFKFHVRALRISRSLFALAAFLLSTLSARAVTNSFDTAADLSPLFVQGYLSGAIGFSENGGTGGAGGITMMDSDVNIVTDHAGLVYATSPFNAAANGQFSTSLMVNFKEFQTATAKDKSEIRLGFTTSTSVNGSKPHEFLSKTNPCISVKLSGEHQTGTTDRRIQTEVVSFTTGEEKPAALAKTVNGASYFQNWLRLTFTATKTGASTFSVSISVEDCGPDGMAAPTLIPELTAGPATVTNASFASDTTVFAAFVIKPEKTSAATTYVDNYTYDVSLPPPAAPVASAATGITSTAFTANWSAGLGVPPTSYEIELTTAADNFAPGTFLAANGAGGQSAGVTTTALSQTFSNLSATTNYVYRVRASNTAGTSATSNVIATATIAGNAPPTLDAIPAQAPARPTDGVRTINLTGISAGGEAGQTVTLTATSSNPAILPHPSISYSSPATAGTLTFDPNGAGVGEVTITVTANDGEAENNTLVRTFSVLVQNPPPLLGFETDAELINLYAQPVNVSIARQASTGTGAPASSGLVVQGTNGSVDKGAIVWRSQSYSGVSATDLHASIFFNPREVDDLATKDKGELNIGFVGSTTINTTKPQEFLRKTNPGLSVKLNAEHDTQDSSKIRKLEAESVSFDGFNEVKGPKLTVLNSPAINNWLKVVFDATRVGPQSYAISYRVEDWGADGTALVGVLLDGTSFTAENAAIAADAEIWAAFSASPEKSGVARLYLDQFESTAGENPPASPVALNAVQVTGGSFLAKWQQGAGVYAPSYVLEVSTAANNFAAGTFIDEDGVGGQASGIVVSGDAFQQRVSNLLPSTAYVYRVRGANAYGNSANSNVIAATTLALGENSAPTLDPIADLPALNINSSQQTVSLAGISAGGEADQFASVTASSSNPSLIPDPIVDYSDPDETATLYFSPVEGQTGSAVITVTVDDGQAENSLITRTFTITVTEPQTLVGFNDLAAMSRLDIESFMGATFNFGSTAGIAGGGGAVFTRTGSLESTTVAYRQTSYDATVSPWMKSSIFINVREAMGIATGKDKAELRFGFAGSNTPNATSPKDSLNKTHPTLGLAFKAEQQIGDSSKNRKVEIEMFSYNGTTESKSAKVGGTNVAATANWLQVNFSIVRANQDQYYLFFDVQDYGVNGTAWQGQLFSNGPFLVTNAPFFSDTSVFAGFSYSPEKTSVANVYFDNYEVVVNTTAPDAPMALAASNVRAREFTAQWGPASIGLAPDGYVLDVSTLANNFAAGTLLNASGVGGQTNGIAINSNSTTSLAITGLAPNTNYVYRLRAKRGSELSMSIGKALVTTLATDLQHWRESNFAGQLGNLAVSGPDADPDGDGVKNLMEYALGMNPLVPSRVGLPVVDESDGYLSISFLRRVNAPDVLYLPQTSGDLADEFGPDFTEVFASEPDANGLQLVIVEDNVPMSYATARFMRLKLQSIP